MKAILPDANRSAVTRLLAARALRAFADGYMSLLLPFYLTQLGYAPLQIGVLITATLLGSGLLTLALGFVAHRYNGRSLLLGAATLMMSTGLAFAAVREFWPLLAVAFLGTLNPSSGDVSVFLPLEQSQLAHAAAPEARTTLFARYSLFAALAGAVGAQAAGLPTLAALHFALPRALAMQWMFWVYAAIGAVIWMLYRNLHIGAADGAAVAAQPLRESRAIVYRLAALFSLDAFAGGFVVQSMLALWLAERYALPLHTTATIFLWVGLLSAVSQLLSAKLARRIGLVNTMVYTHLPANCLLVAAPFMPTLAGALTCLLLRSTLSQMDVPARTSYVMAVVSPGERAAAASFTAVPRSLASAMSPGIAGFLLLSITHNYCM